MHECIDAGYSTTDVAHRDGTTCSISCTVFMQCGGLKTEKCQNYRNLKQSCVKLFPGLCPLRNYAKFQSQHPSPPRAKQTQANNKLLKLSYRSYSVDML